MKGESMIESLLYVSNSRVDPTSVDDVLEALIAEAATRNKSHGISGAIMFTETHFVQIIEGAPEKVESLLQALRGDTRHTDIVIVERGPVPERRFAEWCMAYAGQSQFIGRQIKRVLNNPSPGELRRAADWLTDIMLEFVAR